MLREQLRLRNDHILAQRKSLPSEPQGQLPDRMATVFFAFTARPVATRQIGSYVSTDEYTSSPAGLFSPLFPIGLDICLPYCSDTKHSNIMLRLQKTVRLHSAAVQVPTYRNQCNGMS